MDYINFDLHFESAPPSGYTLSAESEMGQAHGRCALDPAAPELKKSLTALARGRAQQADLQKLGEMLARCALPSGEVETLFLRTVGAAQGRAQTGVCLRLRLTPPELAELPWELLWRAGEPAPLCVSTQTAVTRFVEVNVPMRALPAPAPLKLLGLAPTAEGGGPDPAPHREALTQAATPLGPALTLDWLKAPVTTDAIRSALIRLAPHLVHVITHGGQVDGQPGLNLNDLTGDDYPVSAERFTGLFRNRDAVRLVTLNVCASTALGLRLAQQGLPAVVAMQYELPEWAAEIFTRDFYQTLCAGPAAGEVVTALTQARAALYEETPDSTAFITPVLWLRATSHRLWDQPEPEAESGAPNSVQVQTGNGIQLGNNAQIGGNVVTGGVQVGNISGVSGGKINIAGGNITTKTSRRIDTGGGAYIQGAVNTGGGDFVARDQYKTMGMSPADAARLFEPFFAAVEQRAHIPPADKAALKSELTQAQAEVAKGSQADGGFLEQRLRNIGRTAPDLLEVVLAGLANPIAAVPVIAKKLADKMRAAAGKDKP